jgi:hypothetical protein
MVDSMLSDTVGCGMRLKLLIVAVGCGMIVDELCSQRFLFSVGIFSCRSKEKSLHVVSQLSRINTKRA